MWWWWRRKNNTNVVVVEGNNRNVVLSSSVFMWTGENGSNTKYATCGHICLKTDCKILRFLNNIWIHVDTITLVG